MHFANDDFMDDIDFGSPESFDYNKKDKSEELNEEEINHNQSIIKYSPVENPLLFFSDLKIIQ